MHWILQDNLFHEEGFRTLLKTLSDLEIPHSLHKVIPFVGDIEPDINPDCKNVIVMGSYSMRHLAKKRGWVPGCFDIGEITYQDQIEKWPGYMLNEDSKAVRFADVPEHYPSEVFFIRPVNDTKTFAGMVTDKEKFSEWYNQVVVLEEDDGTSLRADTMVMVAPTKKILREYRVWIIDQRVITSSLYKIGNKVLYSDNVDIDIMSFATRRAKEFSPARAYVMDVALMENNKLRIIETNTINSSGFYAANIFKLVCHLDLMKF